jgi:replicative DNA helicase
MRSKNNNNNKLQDCMNNPNDKIKIGLSSVDVITGGLKPSEMMVIAGQGRTGKTSLALSIAKNVAVDGKTPCAFFSMEMSNVKLVNRLISNVCDVNGDKIQNGQLNHDEWKKLDGHMSHLLDSPLYLDDTPSLTMNELGDKMHKMTSEYGVKFFIIDCLQSIDCDRQSYADNLSVCLNYLKSLAYELQIVIIGTSMLRSGSEEKYRYPKMSDHQEFMVFNDFADYSVFLYRPDHYQVQYI